MRDVDGMSNTLANISFDWPWILYILTDIASQKKASLIYVRDVKVCIQRRRSLSLFLSLLRFEALVWYSGGSSIEYIS